MKKIIILWKRVP